MLPDQAKGVQFVRSAEDSPALLLSSGSRARDSAFLAGAMFRPGAFSEPESRLQRMTEDGFLIDTEEVLPTVQRRLFEDNVQKVSEATLQSLTAFAFPDTATHDTTFAALLGDAQGRPLGLEIDVSTFGTCKALSDTQGSGVDAFGLV